MKDIQVQITKSQRKTLSMRFDIHGVLQVRSPLSLADKQIQSFIEKNKPWIEKQQNKQKIIKTLSPEDIHLLKQQAHDYIPARVAYFAEKYNFHYIGIRIGSARTRWGSCSSQKILNFSCRLMLFDKKCVDYVIIHELCHLREMNHSKKFWSYVAEIMPDYKHWENMLKHHQYK